MFPIIIPASQPMVAEIELNEGGSVVMPVVAWLFENAEGAVPYVLEPHGVVRPVTDVYSDEEVKSIAVRIAD